MNAETMVGVQVKTYGQSFVFQGLSWLSFVGAISTFLTSSNEMKSFFSLLLEQMGKFYELFEMDAHVGAKELNLQYMKVSMSNLELYFFF